MEPRQQRKVPLSPPPPPSLAPPAAAAAPPHPPHPPLSPPSPPLSPAPAPPPPPAPAPAPALPAPATVSGSHSTARGRCTWLLVLDVSKCAEAVDVWMRSGQAKSVDAVRHCENDPYVICTVARLFHSDRKLEKARTWSASPPPPPFLSLPLSPSPLPPPLPPLPSSPFLFLPLSSPSSRPLVLSFPPLLLSKCWQAGVVWGVV
eukprot:216263-Rhodomonas_salina.3